ncbi:MAG TPA: hypothetical protein VGJ05_20875 [Fimbriiglobus sp.]|jgi:hypothetical protein
MNRVNKVIDNQLRRALLGGLAFTPVFYLPPAIAAWLLCSAVGLTSMTWTSFLAGWGILSAVGYLRFFLRWVSVREQILEYRANKPLPDEDAADEPEAVLTTSH